MPFGTLWKTCKTEDLNTLLRQFLHNDIFLNSVYWSSPSLYETISQLHRGTLTPGKTSKAITALKKYLVRSATRCTPYGTFAGIGIQRFDHASPITQSSVAATLDNGLIFKIIKNIESDPDAQKLLRYRINPTLYDTYNKYRYLALVDHEYHLNSIYKTEMIDIIFRKVSSELYSIAEMVDFLPSGFTDAELFDFVTELAEADFLQSEISSLIYSENALPLLSFLTAQPGYSKGRDYTEIISSLMRCQSLAGDPQNLDLIYPEINSIKEKLQRAGISHDNILQLDLLLDSKNIRFLSPVFISRIEKTIHFLNSMDFSTGPDQSMSLFKKIFRLRYENSEQRLVDVLDPETGIGFPVFSGIGTYHTSDVLERMKDHSSYKETLQEDWAPAQLINIIEQNAFEADIDLASFFMEEASVEKSLPPTFYVLGSIVDDQQFFLQTVGGSSARTLISRFTHLHQEIKKLYGDIAVFEREAQPDLIRADIVFLPHTKAGNVTRPRNQSDYEISILGENSASDYKIRISDLYISLSNDEIILRSSKLNKRIIPVLPNAHNFTRTSAMVYHFISSIQHEGTKQLGIEINQYKSKKRYIPRISYQHIILRRASWLFFKDELLKIRKSNDAVCALKALLSQWKVPQYITLAMGDQELFIDTGNNTYLQMLLDEISTSSCIYLNEWLYSFHPGTPEYMNEIIIPFKNHSYRQYQSHDDCVAGYKTAFSYIPGSRWLYYKIYCNAAFSDELLRDYLFPLLHHFLLENKISKGFFIRFTDPDYHIRFRVYASRSDLVSDLMQIIYDTLNPLTDSDLVWKVCLATYEPEIYRYKEENMDLIERAFSYDSILIFQLLHENYFTEDSGFRMLLAVKNLHYWLILFGLTHKEKLEFCENSQYLFEKEFSAKEKRNIYSEYRNLFPLLKQVMADQSTDPIFSDRNIKIKVLGIEKEYLTDLIHMSVNRWFPSQQRFYEYIMYIFASKYYKGIIFNHNHENNKFTPF